MQVTQITKSKPTKINNLILYILPSLALFIIVSLFIGHQISIAPTTSALDSAATSTELSVQAASLSVDVSSNSVILDIAPTYEGVFEASDPLTVNVDTTNTYGYNLMMTTTTTTSLVSTVPLSDGSTYPTIETLADDNSGSGYDSANFPTNKWGYTANGSNYLPVAYDNTLRVTTGQNNPSDRSNIVTFGTKLNTEIATGNYNITLNFIATANAPSNLDDFDAAFIFAGKTKYNGYYKMQDMTANICSYVATPTTTTSAPSIQLIDTRDNKIYWISKLKDGNCWMTQNLDLNLDSTVALTSANTDLHSVDSWTPVRSTINASGNTMNTYPTDTGSWATDGTNSWSDDNYTPYSVDAGYKYILPIEKTGAGAGTLNDQPYDTVYNSLAECQAAASDSSKNSFGLACDGHTSVGNYYNSAAANATNNISSTLASIGKEDVQNVDLPDSICPAGWRLPKDQNGTGLTNEFDVLLGGANYNLTSSFIPSGLNAIRQAPLYIVRSGFVESGSLYYVGAHSNAWSSTISGATYGYYLNFDPSDINPAFSNSRFYGFPVRCLARTSISDITYMQEFATMTDAKKEEVKATMVTGTAYQLIDNRDNEVYNVAKLADGNVWLLDNLRLDPATLLHQLTPANTNMDPNIPFTLPESSYTSSNVIPAINTEYKKTLNSKSGERGVFYNYCAASAGTVCKDSTPRGIDYSYDICPSSWRIPTHANWNYADIGSLNFVDDDGTIYDGAFNEYDGDAKRSSYWSSTPYDETIMHGAGYRSDIGYTRDRSGSARYYMTPVRCLLK